MLYKTLVVIIIITIIYTTIIGLEMSFNDAKEKSKQALLKNFTVTLSLLPVYTYSNTTHEKFIELIDFLSTIYDTNSSMYHNPKISIKIFQLSNDPEVAWGRFLYIVKHAKQRNIFIWISTVTRNTLKYEYRFFVKIRKLGFNNVGITLSTYNFSVHCKLDTVLNMGGNVRLVKGVYAGDITDWDVVTNNYLICAKKLINSGNYHTLATHDFDVLLKLYYYRSSFINTIELAFFHHAEDYVNHMLMKMPFVPKYKTFYIAYGNYFEYFTQNICKIDLVRSVKRLLHGIMY
tara:strand:- start:283 stop:1152 length:870 start_codon:yes stop_codon:yes gene_type:complete